MAITAEVGLGSASANSFVTVDEADTYHENINNTAWAALSDEAKEAAIIRAGSFLNGLSWRGERQFQLQAMCWPRVNVLDDDDYLRVTSDIPTAVKNAQMELAYRESQTAGVLAPDLERGGAVKRKNIVGAIETEYFEGASPRTEITIVQQLLKGLLRGSTSIRFERC